MKRNVLEERLREMSPQEIIDVVLKVTSENKQALKQFADYTASPKEKISGVRKTISSILTSIKTRGFFKGLEVAQKLELMLPQIESIGALDPSASFLLLSRLLEVEGAIYQHVDDSSGRISGIYRGPITNLFVRYVQLVRDDKTLANGFSIVCADDEIGTKSILLEKVAEFLPDDVITTILNDLASHPLVAPDSSYFHWDKFVQMRKAIYKGLGDYASYQKLSMSTTGMYVPDWLNMIEMYLDHDEVEKAGETFKNVKDVAYSRNEEAADLYKRYLAVANKPELTKAFLKDRITIAADREASEMFKKTYGTAEHEHVLSQLTDLVNNPNRKDHYLDYTRRLDLLLTEGRVEDVANHVASLSKPPEGSFEFWLHVANTICSRGFCIQATILLRTIVMHVLENGNNTYYRGAAHLYNQLCQIHPMITEWGSVPSHEVFSSQLRQRHGFKSSFWRHVPPE